MELEGPMESNVHVKKGYGFLLGVLKKEGKNLPASHSTGSDGITTEEHATCHRLNEV